LAQVAFWAEMASALELAVESAVCVGWVEVHLFLCVSSVSQDFVPCDFARKASVCVILTKHRCVAVYRSIQLFMSSKLNTPHLLFADLGIRLFNQLPRFLY
jgi:hypothetical protein